MQKLVRGVHRFQTKYFATHRELFEELATTGQHPETLFITCSDSRVVPNLITNAAPGELFIVRNIGNMVPDIALAGGTAAAIEYAVEVLSVSTIIVCGHTQCGAMQALLEPSRTEHLPFVRKWLGQTGRLREIVRERYADCEGDALLTAAAEENVLVQLDRLREFPFVADRLERGQVRLSGWVFKIQTGEVFDYDPEQGQFVPIVPEPLDAVSGR
jgi:carbonic anhydrase